MAAGRTRRALKRCLCSALPMASVARGTGARRAAPRSRSSGTDIHPMSPLPRWLFLGFNALRQRGMRLASPPSPCPHNRGGCGSAGGRCWGCLEEEQGMGSLCPRPIFCFPWFVQKKIEKIGDFFFPWLCCFGYRWRAEWGLLPLLPHCGKGMVAPCTGGSWWQGGAVGVPIAPTAAFRGTPFLQHRGSLLCLIHKLFEAFPLHFYFMERLQICFHPQQNHPIPGPWVCVVPRDPSVGVPLGRGCREGRVSAPLAPSPRAAPGAGPIWPLPLPTGPPCMWLLQNLPQNSPIPSP